MLVVLQTCQDLGLEFALTYRHAWHPASFTDPATLCLDRSSSQHSTESTMRLLKLSAFALAAETAYGYLDTSPFFMFSTSEYDPS